MKGGERERERVSFNMQIKHTTLFSLAKINHNWAGTHNHRGNLMTYFIFGSHTPNLSAPLPCVLLRVCSAFTDFSKKNKKSDYQRLSILTALCRANFFNTTFPLILIRIASPFTCWCVDFTFGSLHVLQMTEK